MPKQSSYKMWSSVILIVVLLALLLSASSAAQSATGEQFREQVPFPRTYMLYQLAPPANGCLGGATYKKIFEEKAQFANVIETLMDYDSDWKIDLVGATDPGTGQPIPDGDCNDAGDKVLLTWLAGLSDSIGKNRWNLTAPHYQVAFVSTWNYLKDDVGAERRQQRDVVSGGVLTYPAPAPTPTPAPCGKQWPLLTASSPGPIQRVNWREFQAANVWVNGQTCSKPPLVPGSQRYIDWLPGWLDVNLYGESTAWDGIRIDSPGNIHSYNVPPGVNQDLNNCEDYRQNLQGNGCAGAPTAEGKRYLNNLYREGNQYIFDQLHQLRPAWLLGGNDAWQPETNAASIPGFAKKADIDFTIAEDWTLEWGDQSAGWPSGVYRFVGWSNPEAGFTHLQNLAEAAQNWQNWSQAASNGVGDKGFVIMSKWCSDPTQRECGNDNEINSTPGTVTKAQIGYGTWNEYDRNKMYKEFRFSLAAATMFDAYHSFMAEGYFKCFDANGNSVCDANEHQEVWKFSPQPSWFDEYAVYPNYDAAVGVENKKKGIGWLGFPTTDMIRVNTSGQQIDSLQDALTESRFDDINNNVWVRYFDHGVVLLNPTNSDSPAKLLGSFRKIRCSYSVDQTQSAGHWYDCQTNSGAALGVNPSVTVKAHDGLFIVKDAALGSFAIAASSGDVEHYEYEAWLPDERGEWDYQWLHEDISDGSTIGIASSVHWQRSATLSFNGLPLSQGADIEDAFIETYVDGADSPDIFIAGRNISPELYARWKAFYLGQGWAPSANVSRILQVAVDQSNWNGNTTFYLHPVFLGSEVQFRTYDYGANHAPKLRYRVAVGGPAGIGKVTVSYQHGANGYTGGQDTHIVTTNWETPTPHDTFPILYVRTNNTDNEVKSSLVRFTDLNLPANAEVLKAELLLYFSGQSVNGGDMTVYVSGPQRPWLAPQTTWVNYSSGQYWQATGAKGTEDRGLHSNVRTVNYSEVGSWLSFDVTDLAQQGVYEFLLFGSYAGVNKDIQFPSDEYWDAFKRPKLVITYTS